MAQGELDRAAGAALKDLRTARGMSQEALAMAAEVDQSMLSKIERLGPGATGWTRFCRIAEALGHEVVVTFRSRSAG